VNLIDLAHELALIENITRADLTLNKVSPARNDFMEGYDQHTWVIGAVLGLVTYDRETGEYV
jgi:arabinogalactan endo-1,4-beta-galactosidase